MMVKQSRSKIMSKLWKMCLASISPNFVYGTAQAGTPMVSVEDDYDAEQKKYTINHTSILSSHTRPTHKKPLHIPIKMGLLDQERQ